MRYTVRCDRRVVRVLGKGPIIRTSVIGRGRQVEERGIRPGREGLNTVLL